MASPCKDTRPHTTTLYVVGGCKQNKQNKTKQNKTKQNKTKQNKTKQNKTKQNKNKTTANLFYLFSYQQDNGTLFFELYENGVYQEAGSYIGGWDTFDDAIALRINGELVGNYTSRNTTGNARIIPLSGRFTEFQPTSEGLLFKRKIYFPANAPWGRWLEIIENPTDNNITVDFARRISFLFFLFFLFSFSFSFSFNPPFLSLLTALFEFSVISVKSFVWAILSNVTVTVAPQKRTRRLLGLLL